MKKIALIYVLAVIAAAILSSNAFADFYVISSQKKCCTCEGTQSTGGRWCDNGDGTVTDMTTCLVWLKYADWGGQKAWRNTSSECGGDGDPCYNDAHQRAGRLANGVTIKSGETPVTLTDGSACGDWRLPTRTELEGITKGDEYVRDGTGGQLFEGVQQSFYWSSTTHASLDNQAMMAWMFDGSVSLTNKSTTLYVWPIRPYK